MPLMRAMIAVTPLLLPRRLHYQQARICWRRMSAYDIDAIMRRC